MVPNVYIWEWESDLVYISNKLFVTEYEIKISRGDFIADRQKREKHRRLRGLGVFRDEIPKFFYYVCPKGLIKTGEIPQYSGLFYVDWEEGALMARRMIKAPGLPAKPLSADQYLRLLKKGCYKYWQAARRRGRRKETRLFRVKGKSLLDYYCKALNYQCQACRRRFSKKSGVLRLHEVQFPKEGSKRHVDRFALLCKECHDRVLSDPNRFVSIKDIDHAFGRRFPCIIQ
jgi:hypothetical protein